MKKILSILLILIFISCISAYGVRVKVSTTGGVLRSGLSAGNTALLEAYDVDGAVFFTFGTLTSNNTPTFDLDASVTIGGALVYSIGGTDVAVADGGTGVGSWTNGQLLIGDTTGSTAILATLTGTANQVTITNGSSTITLSLPQDVHSAATPTFGDITITGADPALVFNTTTATDTDFYMAINEDAGNDDDDTLQIGKGTIKGTTPFMTWDKDGGFIAQNLTDAVTGYQWLDADGGTPILNIDSVDERVGIGTNIPGVTLDVIGLISAGVGSQTAPSYSFGGTNSDVGMFINSAGGNQGLRFTTNGSQKVMITNNGDIGMGTETPGARLELLDTNNQLRLAYSTTIKSEWRHRSNGDLTVTWIGGSSNNFGINTTGPDRKLDVLDASDPQLRLTHTDGSVYTDFQTDASGLLTITPSGAFVLIPARLVHTGDTDTFMAFSDDSIQFLAGNTPLLTILETAAIDAVVVGDGTKHDGYFILAPGEVQTTDATQTTVDSITLLDENTYMLEAFVVGVQSDGTDRASYHIAVTVYRTAAGGATIQGTVTSLHTQESNASLDATFTVSGNDVRCSVTGIAAETWEFGSTMKYMNMSN